MSNVKFISVPSKRLAVSIDGSATSFQLNNINGWDGNALTAADFGAQAYAVFRNDTNTAMEIMEIDPTTIASASISIVNRGLKFNGDLTTVVPGNKLTWIKNTTIVELGTDVPQLLNHTVQTDGVQTINDLKTFSTFPQKSGGTSPSAGNEFATKAYVDGIVGGSTTYDQGTLTGTAGETLVAGNLVYFKEADQRWWKAKADAAATSQQVKIGIAQSAATAGISVTVLWSGVDKSQVGLTAGTKYYISATTGGALTTTPGTFRRFVGTALSTTAILTEFNNDPTLWHDGSENYAADTGSANAYAIAPTIPIGGYKNGMTVRMKAANTNTGASTLNVSSLGTQAIKKEGTIALEGGEIVSGQIYEFVYDGTNFQLLNAKIGTPVGAMLPYGGVSAPQGWLLADGSAVSRTTYANLFNVLMPSLGVATMTIASPAVVTRVAHGLILDDKIYFTTTGALPTGVSANTIYYIISAGLTADNFQFSASKGGSAVNTSGSQSGVHTLGRVPWGLGDGSTTFNVPSAKGNIFVGQDTAQTEFNSIGETGGEKTHTLTLAEMASHTHGIAEFDPGGGGNTTSSTGQVTGSRTLSTNSAGSDGAHNNLQPYLVALYIIKT